MADLAAERAGASIIAGHPADEVERLDTESVSTIEENDNGNEQRVSKELTRLRSGISVEAAEAEFQELQREFTGVSRASRTTKKTNDPEKNVSNVSGSDEDSVFDLELALRGDLDAGVEAGIRSKHIGVFWNGLTVKGLGGKANYVSTFPSAIVNFFDVITPVINMLGLGKKPIESTLLHGFSGVCKPGEMVLVLGKP